MTTGHSIARNCQVSGTASRESVHKETRSEENQKKNTSENMWIAEWGIACHVTNSLEGHYNIREVTESLMSTYGKEIYAMKCGKLQATVMTKEGKLIKITLEEVHYVPGFHAKFFSILCAMRRGAKILSEVMMLTVKNGLVRLVFGSHRKDGNDFVLGLELKPIQYNDTPMPMVEHEKSQVLMNCSKETAEKWEMYESLCEN